MRPSGREADELRPVRFTPGFTRHAEGSVLAEFGETRVLCTASVEERVPPWLRGKGSGWVTGEYGMLPRSTHTRMQREAARGKQVALALAIRAVESSTRLKRSPLRGQVAAISVGIYSGVPVLDLDYAEDSAAETDMNVVMNDGGRFVEVQGTAEGHAFTAEEFDAMIGLARAGISEVVALQNAALID